MSQNPNIPKNFSFSDITSGFLPGPHSLREPKNEVLFEFGSREYSAYWQEMQQQVNQQQQQQETHQRTQQQSLVQHQSYAKLTAMDGNILTPTIEMDELIIKTEPPDDINILKPPDDMSYIDKALNTNAFYRSANMASFNNMPFYNIKEEPSTSQQKSLNFPRRKLQTERSETLPICQRCKQVFLKKSSYMKHVRHSSCSILEYNFQCLICPMSFMSPEELQAHEHVHRSNQFFCQKYCGKYFDTLDLCEAHEYMFHDFELFVCNVCISTYKSRDQLFAHKTQHRHLIKFDCPICRQWFTSPNELRRHRLESPFMCGKFFSEDKVSMHTSETYRNSGSLNENNYNIQDCNITVMEASAPICSNVNFSSHHAHGNNHFPSIMNIKTEPVFDPPSTYEAPPTLDTFYHNPYGASLNFDSSFSMSPYNEFNNPFHIMERRYSSNFNFSAPYIPATPAVNEGDALCCVPHCGLRKSTAPTQQFFKFPKDLKYLKQWLHNMKLIYNPSESYEDYRICSQHFPKRVINLHSLCYWAVPTYHLGHEDTANIFHNRDQNYYAQPQCSMPSCESQRGKTNLKFYNFPTNDTDTYVKWCQNARLPLNSKEARQLCSRHFEDKCFGKIRLKVWAVPTLYLGGYPCIHDNPPVPMLEVKKCCLPHCRRKRSEDPSLSLYSFPKDELLLQRWCYNLKLDPMEYRGKFHKVCSAHFVKDVIGSIKLHSGAVPTLNLGHNAPNIYNNEVFTMTSTTSKSSPYSNSISSSSSSGSIASFETPDTCSLPSCKRNRYADNVSMHTMPGRPEMLQKWCHNIKIDPQKIPKYFRLCSVHFEPYCIGGCMRPFAVPTLHLGHDDPNIHRNPKVIKKLHIRETCCVATCRRNRERDKANLHRFPLHKPELLQKWLDNLRRPMPDGTRLFNDAICERHFEERCIRTKRLERWAIPTLELGHNEEVMPLPTEAELEELYAKQMGTNSSSNSQALECCVKSCQRNPKTDDVKLYALPEDEVILDKWSHNLQQDLRAIATVRICNLHFETHCIGKRLQPWAVPTLNLPPSAPETLFENPKEMKALSAVKLLGYAPRCCLPHCRKQRSDGKVQLFRFPSYSKSMLKKWCHNLQISAPMTSGSHRRVCSSHFEPHVLTKRCPMPNSVPTLELNCPTGYKIYQNPERLKLAKLRTQRLCVIPSCGKSKSDGVQLFLYPHNRALLRQWAYNTKQKAGECSRGQLRVCSEHFEPNCFGPVRLCPGAIPTLKLGHDDPGVFPNNLPPLEEQEMQCIVADCKRSRAADGVKLFRFPSDDEDLLWKWCNNLKLNPVDSHKSRICNMHFESDCVGPRGLFRWAIPTLLLGQDDCSQQLHLNPKPHERISTEQIFRCCVPLCGRTRKYDEAQLNSFPKTRERFCRWMHNLRLNGHFSEREKYRICNAHFEPQCLGKQRLNLGAIPTLRLGHDSDDIYQVDSSELHPWYTSKRSRLSLSTETSQTTADFLEEDSAKCCYTDCTASKSAQRESYSMPKHPALQELWCEVLKINKGGLSSDAKLCGLHFIELYEATAAAVSALLETNVDISDELQVLAAAYEQCSGSSLTRSMQCTVPNCKTTSLNGKGLKLYQFPYNRELCEKWCFNTTIELDEQRRHLHKVCTLHFEHHCVSEAQRLRPWAIPTLHLPPPHPPHEKLYENPDLVGLNRRHLGPQSSKCCVRNCLHRNGEGVPVDSVKLFNFPTDSDLIDKWLHNLRGCVERDKCPLYKICALHFEKQCISKMTRLRPWAIPTLGLGFPEDDQDYKLFQNPAIHTASSTETRRTTTDNSGDPSLVGCKIKNTLDLIKCCVTSCRKSRLQHGIRFLDFPADTKTLKRWCFNLQLPLATPKKLQHICNQHFEKRCFVTNKRLHSWAVPTLNLGQQLSFELYKNPKNNVVRVRSGSHSSGLYLPVCCVPGCGKRRTKNNNLQTFAFPKQEPLLQQWCSLLQLESVDAVKGGRVCEEHFAPEDRFRTKLKRDVLPTRQLPIVNTPSTIKGTNEFVSTSNQVELTNGGDNMHPERVTFKKDPAKITRCCITRCCNHQRPLVGSVRRLFKFPRPSQLLLRKWCHNTQQPFKRRLRLRICPLHFESQALLNGKPRPWAIPTLELGHQNPIYNNPTTTTDKEKCCILDCAATAPVKLFSYPKRSTLLRKWAHNTKQDAYLALRRNYKVCSKHFEAECIKAQGNLSFGAIPTLYLGHQNEDNYTNEAVADSFYCGISGCKRGTLAEGIKLFEFPTDDAPLLKRWCHNLKLEPENCKELRICNLHFEDRWINKCKLVAGAVPTLLLGHDDNTLELWKPKTEGSSKTANTASAVCCVPNCVRSRCRDDVHMISFPKNNEVYLKWLHNLKLKPDPKMRDTSKVCSVHFEEHCKMGPRIKLGAIPSLHLGHLDTKIYRNKDTDILGGALCSLTACRAFKLLQGQLFEMPKCKEIRQHWCEKGLQVKMLDSDAKLCALHFMAGYESHRAEDLVDRDENSKETFNLTETYKSIRDSPRWRMFRCCARDCHIKLINTSDIQLFKFPEDDEMYQKWCYNTGVEPEMDLQDDGYRVCALHFEAHCFETSKLRPWAVPTLKLNNVEDIKIYYNPDKINHSRQESEKELNEAPKSVCCVENCFNAHLAATTSTNNPKLWGFPRNTTVLEHWCHNIGLNVLDSKNLQICSAHFEAYCFSKASLRCWAIPTQLLNPAVIDAYKNPHVKDLSPTQQSKICCVYDCRQQRDDEAGIKLFKFPQKPQKLEKWLNNLQLSGNEGRSLRICSLHFERSCYRTSRLCGWAVPTVNLGHDDQPSIIGNQKLRHHLAKCCLTHCRKNRRTDCNIHLHNFPKVENTRNKWLHNLNFTTDHLEHQSTGKRKLCSAHFERVCFSGRRLKSWALPTLDLGHKQPIYENPQQQQPHHQQQQLLEENNEDLQQCCVTGCCNITSYRNLFGFPADEDLLQKWCENLEFENIAKYRRTKCRVCAKHFESNALRNNSYLPGVVPTLRLGHDKKPKHNNPLDLNKYHACSLQLDGCIPSDFPEKPPNLRVFSCPKHDAKLWAKWCSNLRLNEAQEYGCVMLCSTHFAPEVIVGNKLKPGAVPTLNLGHALAPVYANSHDLCNLDETLLCAVINCTQPKGTYLYDFPTESMLLAKWCANLKLPPQECLHKKICSTHFETTDIGQGVGSLPQGALPTLRLGHFEQPAYDAVMISKKRKRTLKCCVNTCPRTKAQNTNNVQLYRFPKINWMLRKWCYNLRMSATGDAENLRICAGHFERHCLGQAKLKPWALPTLALGHQQHIYTSIKLHQYHALEKACDEMQFVRSNYCAIVSCLKSNEDGVQLFRYPRKDALLRKWAENCKHNASQAERHAFRICSVHFDEHCLVGGGFRLRPGSIPTVLLGHNDENIHHHGLEMLPAHTNPSSVTDLDLDCCVPGCGRSKLSDNIRLFAFPKDGDALESWCHNLKLIVEECRMPNMRVCNLHFEERCFSARYQRVRTRAVPTLLLGHSDTANIIPNPISFERPDSIVCCCVPKCGKSKQLDSVHLHCFPKNRKMFEQWMQNLKLDLKPTAEVWAYYRVCSEHFENYCYGPGKRLLFGTLPTLKLGHSDVESIHQIKPEMISTTTYEQKKRKKPVARLEGKCSLPDCRRTWREIHIYSMPKHPKLQSLWLESLNLPSSDEGKLCMLHFKLAYDRNYDQMMQLSTAETAMQESENAFTSELMKLAEIHAAVSSSTRFLGMQCCVLGCGRNLLTDDIKLYTFPYNRDVYEKWCHNTKMQVSDQQRYLYKVCTLHFESHVFIEPSKRLRPWALPTLNLPTHTPPATIIPNPDLAEPEARRPGSGTGKQCCIPSCVNAQQERAAGVVYYKFPRQDAQLFHMWIYNTQLRPNEGIYAYVCSQHFERHCFDNSRLQSWALPTLYLGHNKPNIHQNPMDKIMEANKELLQKMETNNADDDGEEKYKWEEAKIEIEDEKSFDDEDDDSDSVENSSPLAKQFGLMTDKKPFVRKEERKKEEIKKSNWSLTEYYGKAQKDCSQSPEITLSTNESEVMGGPFVNSFICHETCSDNFWQNERKVKPDSSEDSYSDSDNLNKFEITLIEENRSIDNNYNNSVSKTQATTPKEVNTAQYCRIVNCTSRMGQRNVVLHKLPNNPLLRKRWLHNSQIVFDARRPWAYKICSRHFERACYSGQRLIQWAVPTLHLGPKQPTTIYPNAQSKKPIQSCHIPQGDRAEKAVQLSVISSMKSNVETETAPPPSFNFKITAIESINMDSSSMTDEGGGSLSSSELQQSMSLTTTSLASSKHSTSHLICTLPACQRRTNEDFVQLHMLPKDPLLQHKWCHNCHLTPLARELYTTRVCSFHFEQHCFTRTRRQLKLGSIPTLHLGHQDRNIYRNARSLCESFACCVRGCGRRRLQEQARHFRFPIDKATLAKWLHNLQMEFNAKRPWVYNVCEVHFEPYCFGRAGSLLEWAIPTLRLGNTDSRDIHLNVRPSGQSPDDYDDDTLLLLPDHYRNEDNSMDINNSSSHDFSQFEETEKMSSNYRKCILPHCGRSEEGSNNEVNLFRFPKDLELREKWIFNTKFNLNLLDQRTAQVMQICEQHFEANVLGLNNAVLKNSAVPTLNLGHNDDNIYFNDAEEPLNTSNPVKLEPLDDTEPSHEADASWDESPHSSNPLELTKLCCNKLRCFLRHCKLKRSDGIRLFRFPRKTELQLQWEHNLKLGYDSRRRQRHFLCSRHFEPELIGRKFLLRGALPTLHLGHNDTANIYRPSLRASQRNTNIVGPSSLNSCLSPYTHEQQRQLLSCSVAGCRSRDTGSDDVLLFPLPKDRKYAKIWRQRLLLENDVSELVRVCSIHFGRHSISRRNLSPNAIPSLHLPSPESSLSSSSSATNENKRERKMQSSLLANTAIDPNKTGTGCSVPGCHRGVVNTHEDNIKMFSKFPDDFELFTKWCFNLKIDPRKYVDGTYNVCCAHFEPYCIGGHSLRVWAVPTLNLGHNDANIHEVKRPAEMELKCCLSHCGRRNSADGVRFFNFPKGDLYKTWCRILQIDEVLYRNTDKKICSVHFTPDCINGLSLKAGVEPSLHLTAKLNKIAATEDSEYHTELETIVPSRICIVANCTTSVDAAGHANPLLFGFPKNPELNGKWRHNLKLSPQPNEDDILKICFKHFEPNCINNDRLDDEAVPTLKLGHDDDNIFHTPSATFKPTISTEATTTTTVTSTPIQTTTVATTSITNNNPSLGLISPFSCEALQQQQQQQLRTTEATSIPSLATDSRSIPLSSVNNQDSSATFLSSVKQEPMGESEATTGADLAGDDVLNIGDLLTKMLADECDDENF